MEPKKELTIEQYLDEVARFADDSYGRSFRRSFADSFGSSELAMLASPSADELAQLRRAVAIMTPSEKSGAAELTDEQVQRIAADAGVDPADFAIFINGYALYRRKLKAGR